MLAWWRHYGGRYEPLSLALEAPGGSLRGLALLALRRSGRVRTLWLAGHDWSGLEGLVCTEDYEAELAHALLAALHERAGEWDLWRILRLPEGSHLARLLLAGGEPLRSAGHDVRLQPYLSLPVDEAALGAMISRHHRLQLRRTWRKLEALGASTRLVTDPGEAVAAIATLLDLHRGRARARGERHRQIDERFERFLADAVPGLLPTGARLRMLDLGNTTVSSRLDLAAGWRHAAYLTGMSAAHSELSTGDALQHRILLTAIAEGAREYDFGAGRQAYKYRWGARDRQMLRMVISSPTARGQLAGAAAAAELRLRDTRAAELMRRAMHSSSQHATRQAPPRAG